MPTSTLNTVFTDAPFGPAHDPLARFSSGGFARSQPFVDSTDIVTPACGLLIDYARGLVTQELLDRTELVSAKAPTITLRDTATTRFSVHDGAIVFPNMLDAVIATGLDIESPRGTDLFAPYLRCRMTEAPASYLPDEVPTAQQWFRSRIDDRYEGSNLGTLRRVDGSPVGWMPLTRYAEILGMPKVKMISTFAHGLRTRTARTLSTITKGWEHPYNGRATDVQPYYPTTNMLPVVCIPIALSVEPASLMNMAMGFMHDELALIDFTRAASNVVSRSDLRAQGRSPTARRGSGNIDWWDTIVDGVRGTNMPATNVMWVVVPEKINPMGAWLWKYMGGRPSSFRGLRPHMKTFLVSYAGAPVPMNTPQSRSQAVTELIRAEVAAEVKVLRDALGGRAKQQINLMERLKRRQSIAKAMSDSIMVDAHVNFVNAKASRNKTPEMTKILAQHGVVASALLSTVQVPTIAQAIAALQEQSATVSPFSKLHLEPRLVNHCHHALEET